MIGRMLMTVTVAATSFAPVLQSVDSNTITSDLQMLRPQ